MVSRRVIIGKYADGVTFGMKVALPGYDALTEADDSPNLSFNSNWTNIASPLQSGFASGAGAAVAMTDPGYVPFVEARRFSGSTINDDAMEGSVARIGVGANYTVRTPLTLAFDLQAGETALYMAFTVPVVLS